jgi:homoserine O-acetyltransferase
MTDLLIQEAWGDHEALLIKPPRSRGRVPPPVPLEARVAGVFHLEARWHPTRASPAL